MHVPSLIETKRDGGILGEGEIRAVIEGYTEGSVPDYQMSALAMAICLQGMNREETAALTRAMLESGVTFSWPESAPRIVDKHSTGGIGDKVSLVLAPLLACDELWVPMISGRGLGITGGTLDKLESIPGFRVDLSPEEARAQLERTGVVMMGQTADICPADRKLYALRDVTGTVPSVPLIVASILSKKLAESLDALVLDVKYGSGAFMKTRTEAEELGEAMCEVAESMGVKTSCVYTSMDEPLGRAVGNVLEVIEACETLRGGGPGDLRGLVLDLAGRVALENGPGLARWLDDLTAWNKFREMVEMQGGDPDQLVRLDEVHAAAFLKDVRADRSGMIRRVDAGAVGRAALALGAGRSRAGDTVDASAGFDHIAKVGEEVRAGDVIARVHAPSASAAADAEQAFLQLTEIE